MRGFGPCFRNSVLVYGIRALFSGKRVVAAAVGGNVSTCQRLCSPGTASRAMVNRAPRTLSVAAKVTAAPDNMRGVRGGGCGCGVAGPAEARQMRRVRGCAGARGCRGTWRVESTVPCARTPVRPGNGRSSGSGRGHHLACARAPVRPGNGRCRAHCPPPRKFPRHQTICAAGGVAGHRARPRGDAGAAPTGHRARPTGRGRRGWRTRDTRPPRDAGPRRYTPSGGVSRIRNSSRRAVRAA